MAVQTTPHLRWWLLLVAGLGIALIIAGAVPNLVPSGSSNPLTTGFVGILIVLGLIVLIASLLFFMLDILALDK